MAQRLVMTEAIHMGTHHRKRRGRVVEIACVIRWVQYVESQRMYVVPLTVVHTYGGGSLPKEPANEQEHKGQECAILAR